METGYDGLFSKPAEFTKQVKVFYISMGSKEGPNTGRSIHEQLEKAVIRHVYFEDREQHMNSRPGGKLDGFA